MSLKLHSGQRDDAQHVGSTFLQLSADPALGQPVAAAPARQDAAAPAEAKNARKAVAAPTISETIEYILAFTTELKFMAQQAGLARLGLILMLAEQEARQQIERQTDR